MYSVEVLHNVRHKAWCYFCYCMLFGFLDLIVDMKSTVLKNLASYELRGLVAEWGQVVL